MQDVPLYVFLLCHFMMGCLQAPQLGLLFGLGLFHELHFVRSVGPANLVLEATVPLVELVGVSPLFVMAVVMAVALPALFAAPLHVKASHGVAPVMVMVMLLRVMVMLLLLLLAVALDAPATQVMLDAAMHPLCHLLRLMRSALRGVMHFFGGFLDVMMHLLGGLLDVVMHSFGGVMHLLGDFLDVFLHPLVGTLRFLMRPLGSTLRSAPLHELAFFHELDELVLVVGDRIRGLMLGSGHEDIAAL